MTHNQIAWLEASLREASNLETARHNKEVERLTGQQNAITATYNQLQAVNTANSIRETARHNRESEAIQYAQVEAQRAYNAAQLQIANANLLLSNRQQSTRERTLEETIRSNTAKEAEAARHNVAVEVQTSKTDKWSNLLRGVQIVTSAAQGVGIALLKIFAQKQLKAAHGD